MFLPRTRPLAGIVGVGQRRSATEKETCANSLQRLFFGNIRLSSHISLAKSHGQIIITTSFGVIRKTNINLIVIRIIDKKQKYNLMYERETGT